jgi:predicted acyl esterase
VASWQDQGLHTCGTLEGWKKIQSNDKWLECHGRKKWAFYYLPEQVEKQRAFFNKFLKGKTDTGVERWPKVILEIRDGFYKGKFREEKEFPLARAEYKRLYLDAPGSLSTNLPTHERSTWYDSLASGPGRHRSEFDITFDVETEITGYMSAKLFMESPQSDDMHVFVTLWKLDKNGEPVGMTYYAQVFSPPVKLT